MTFRIIPRLEIKNKFLIKGKKMEGLKKIGDPTRFIEKYYNDGADEILLCDIVASLYNRKLDFEFVKKVSKNIYIPLAVGGGLNDINDIKKAFNYGADKVVFNSYLFKNLNILDKVASIFGNQSIVIELQLKKINQNYELRFESGRNNPKVNLIEWIKILKNRSIGEIYIMSVDNDGMENAQIDYSILKKIRNLINVPLIYGGGISEKSQVNKLKDLGYQGAAISRVLHYKLKTISEFKWKKIKKLES